MSESWKTMRQVHREHLIATLLLCGGSRQKAAEMLGVAYKTVYNWLDWDDYRQAWEVAARKMPKPKRVSRRRAK
jgi:transposase